LSKPQEARLEVALAGTGSTRRAGSFRISDRVVMGSPTEDHPGQGPVRPRATPGALPAVRQLHLPQGGEDRNDYAVNLWRTAGGSQLALYLNLNVANKAWRICSATSASAVPCRWRSTGTRSTRRSTTGWRKRGRTRWLPDRPSIRRSYRKKMGGFRPGAGQPAARRDRPRETQRGRDPVAARRAARCKLIVESSGESTEEADVLELVGDTWREIGVKPFSKPSQLTVFRNRIFSGETMVAIAKGLDDGLVTADRPPLEFTPTSQQANTSGRNGTHAGDQRQGRRRRRTCRRAGSCCASTTRGLPAGSRDERRKIWEDILALNCDEVLSIGLVAGVPQPSSSASICAISRPTGSTVGIPERISGFYHPDTFWFSNDAQAALPPAAAAPN